MPIRFRCAYCNQLLGIARRKAGTVVRCPTCAGQVVVPTLEQAAPGAPPGPEQPIFERSDFDQVFKVPAPQPVLPSGSAAAPASPAGAWGTHPEPAFDVERLDPAQFPSSPGSVVPPSGIVLSSTKATLLTVAVILVVAVAFAAGFLVGRLLL
jgi:DNA-directed RNA polymerase subunit RPC12/RpoP